ncbi:sodium/glucose cotransporter [bacterium BMS3Abin03]|nr:sodium/glucose cotransporter [bacterium BMS3Abin03]
MNATIVDYIIIVSFLIGIAVFGSLSGGKQKTIKDYFLGSKQVPWWMACFSIVAAETSTLTFISIPGLAYLTNMNFLQVTFGYLIGRIIVAKVFLPAYYKGELKTAYTYLEERFGGKARTFASVVFIITRTAADGVRLFATAIPLYLILKVDPAIALIIIAVFSLIYTYTGGLKGVIKVDVVLMFLYLGSALLAAVYLLNMLPDGWATVVKSAASDNKFSIINLGFENGLSGFFSDPYTLIGGIIGGAFLSMASHGTDQLIVQRLLATKNLKSAQKAVIGSGVIIIFQFALFLMLGVMLYAFYGPMNVKSDEVFPIFIIEVLPPGITGIIIAGLFAAAMSTLAGSMSSLSSSTMIDIYTPLCGKNISEEKKLKISRLLTILWAALLIISAMIFRKSSLAVVEIALSIASFTYGGLLGTFLLGLLFKRVKQNAVLAGFASGILFMILVISLKIVGWTWYTLIGVIVTIAVGSAITFAKKSRE